MPTGFDCVQDLPLSFSEPSQAEKERSAMRKEISLCRHEVADLRGRMNDMANHQQELVKAVNSMIKQQQTVATDGEANGSIRPDSAVSSRKSSHHTSNRKLTFAERARTAFDHLTIQPHRSRSNDNVHRLDTANEMASVSSREIRAHAQMWGKRQEPTASGNSLLSHGSPVHSPARRMQRCSSK